MRENVVYGIGGHLPEHPNGNVVERMADNGDGTGTRTVYDEAGQVTVETALSDLPIIEPDPPDPAEAIREALAPITPTSTAAQVRTALLGLKAALET